MNEYLFSELFLGQTESFSEQITEDKMEKFLNLTGDNNPFHIDEGFARKMGQPRRVVYGLLTTSLLSKLAGVYLPGKYCIIQSVCVDMAKPVFVGDILTVSGQVKELNDTVEQMVMKISIKNQDGIKVLRGQMKVGFLHER